MGRQRSMKYWPMLTAIRRRQRNRGESLRPILEHICGCGLSRLGIEKDGSGGPKKTSMVTRSVIHRGNSPGMGMTSRDTPLWEEGQERLAQPVARNRITLNLFGTRSPSANAQTPTACMLASRNAVATAVQTGPLSSESSNSYPAAVCCHLSSGRLREIQAALRCPRPYALSAVPNGGEADSLVALNVLSATRGAFPTSSSRAELTHRIPIETA
jgi:hypothetical protein